MNLLAIETSCDETALALISGDDQPRVLVSEVASQIDLHRQTKGIVPEVAARAQLEAILPLLKITLEKGETAGINPDNLDALAVTKGPGLIGSLLVGVETAKTLGLLWRKPVLGIHHLEGHIYAAFASLPPKQIKWPVLALVVSGGHTQLVLMSKHFRYEIIGRTRDDAAGEAFDKIARLLNLSYPGGPAIAEAAAKYQPSRDSGLRQDSVVKLPRPMINSKNLDFSFSGLKTAVYYFLREKKITPKLTRAVAHEAQKAVVDVLTAKVAAAAKKYRPQLITIVGGVSANTALRESIVNLGESLQIPTVIPPINYSTDNAAMIGLAAWYRLQLKQTKNLLSPQALPRLSL